MHYYKTDEAAVALASSHLNADHFRGLATPGNIRISTINCAPNRTKAWFWHAQRPRCFPRKWPGISEYEAYIIEELIPALKSGTGLRQVHRRGWGFNGRFPIHVLRVQVPEIFSSVGSVQGAFGHI